MELLKIKDIITSELNPNLMEDHKLEKLKKLIEREGNYPPLIVNKREGKYRLVDGHQRLRILKELGKKDVKVDIWEVSEEDELMLLATLNKLKGTSLMSKKKELYKELSKFIPLTKLKELSPEDESFFEKIKAKKSATIGLLSEMKGEKKIQIQFIQTLTKEEFKVVSDYIDETYKRSDKGRAIYLMILDRVKDAK